MDGHRCLLSPASCLAFSVRAFSGIRTSREQIHLVFRWLEFKLDALGPRKRALFRFGCVMACSFHCKCRLAHALPRTRSGADQARWGWSVELSKLVHLDRSGLLL